MARSCACRTVGFNSPRSQASRRSSFTFSRLATGSGEYPLSCRAQVSTVGLTSAGVDVLIFNGKVRNRPNNSRNSWPGQKRIQAALFCHFPGYSASLPFLSPRWLWGQTFSACKPPPFVAQAKQISSANPPFLPRRSVSCLLTQTTRRPIGPRTQRVARPSHVPDWLRE